MKSTSKHSNGVAATRGWTLWGCAGGACLALLSVGLVSGPAAAQVPQYGTFRGRLVDDVGTPETGPVALELRVFDAETAGTELYAELHSGVPLDVTGAFAVQFGLGTLLRTTLPPGSEAADFYAGVPRWLEVVVDTEVLTPREVIGTVPWALIAQQANKIVPDPNAPRFEDCGNGTVADRQTGLQWEKKTGTVGGAPDFSDPHNVNNTYSWSSTGTAPDGAAFTDLLARLNGEFEPEPDPTGCFADRCDWELPKVSELQTILIGPEAAPGQDPTCSAAPCIDPDFAAVGGPTESFFYWSASTSQFATGAWYARFNAGGVESNNKSGALRVRAVRAGSCN